MALVLTTHSFLLRRHFRTTRRRLEGKEIIVFSAADLAIPQETGVRQPAGLRAIALTGLRIFLTILLLGSIVAIGSFVIPELYAKVFPERTEQVATHIKTQPVPAPVVEQKKYEPAFDPTLPEGSWVRIPKIGVDTPALPTLDSNEALDTGVWMVPDFGRPGDDEQPIIMAAHRFGWKWWWQNDYWKKNSFYLLTDTQPGDRVEVVYEQRKWVYEIYAVEEGEEITDYDADLILYTCKFLNSPIRYFRYAKLVEA